MLDQTDIWEHMVHGNLIVSYDLHKLMLLSLPSHMHNTLMFHSSSLLTTDGLPPAGDLDSCRRTGMDIGGNCSTHAVLTFLTVTAVIHAVLWGDKINKLHCKIISKVWRLVQVQSTEICKSCSCESYLFVRVRTDLWVTGGEHSLWVTQHRAPVLGVLLCHWNTSDTSHSEEPTVITENPNESDLPLSRLRLQGFSKLLLTSGQPACVLQLLTKPAAVASGTPLSLRKSSAWLLLKFPHKPGGRYHHVNDNTWVFILEANWIDSVETLSTQGRRIVTTQIIFTMLIIFLSFCPTTFHLLSY